MEQLFERHQEYITDVPMKYVRRLMDEIDWDSPLIVLRGPKGVGKSTLIKQRILRQYGADSRKVLYCSADTGYFATHSLVQTAGEFVRLGGQVLAIDEIHKYAKWSSEIKEIFDLYRNLKIVVSGSSLVQINDGQADLSRRADIYDMPGLSFREYLLFTQNVEVEQISLEELLASPAAFCNRVRQKCRPLEFFGDYLKMGYYPYAMERKRTYKMLIENTVNYIIDNELTENRGVDVGNTRKIKGLLQVISEMKPYEVELSKLSKTTGIDRVTLLRYMRYLEEAKILRRLYSELDKMTDLQKPDKLFFDNTNIMYVLSHKEPLVGTLRECFFCNQMASAGHIVEYGGLKTGDFRIDGNLVIEVGGPGKDFSQISDEDISNAALALDGIDSASSKKIPLWAFGCLY